MSMLGTKQPKYKDGRTKQSFKDETDINKLLLRAQKSGTVSHLNKHQGRYADFGDFDFFEAQLKLSAGREIFDDLPSEIRNEFANSPAQFFEYVNNPDNIDRLEILLPGLAEPGRQNINVSGVEPADETKARAERDKITEKVAPEDNPGKPDNGVLEVSDGATKDPEGPSSASTR